MQVTGEAIPLLEPRGAPNAAAEKPPRAHRGGIFKSFPIKWKVVAIVLGVATLISVTEIVLFLFLDSYTFLRAKQERLTLIAEIVGDNCESSLVFQDHKEAANILRSLAKLQTIRSAYLLDGNGGLFASYLGAEEILSVPLLTPEFRSKSYNGDRITSVYDIISDGKHIGTLVLSAGLEDLQQRRQATLFLGGMAVLIFFTLAFLLSLWAQGYLTRPISELGGTIHHIAESKDYSLRAMRTTDDELGSLMDGFNHMLTEIEKRDVQLARQVEVVASTNKELDQFVYVASHDLKAPLRAIDNLSQLIHKSVKDILPEDKKELLALMRGRIKRMENLLDDLLTYSRIGRIESKVETVRLTNLIKDIVHLLAPPEGFVVVIPEDLPVFRTVRTPLEQVIRNLIGNAIKHHPTPARGRVEIGVRNKGQFLEFSIRDNGAGIPEQYHQKIFQMFQTLRPRDEVEGSGMGLAMVKKIVEDQNGKVWLTSEPGQGTCFYFTWPNQPGAEGQ